MSGNEHNYRLLIGKLDEFIRKFYKNQIIRGGLFSAAVVLSCYLLFALLEYYTYLPIGVRALLFFLFLALFLYCFLWMVVRPVLAYFRLGKVIDHRTAAGIIGQHFSLVKDKLLNTLQLREMAEATAGNRELILASIDQKIEELRPVPFTAAVDLRKNRKFLKFALFPAAVILLVALSAPRMLTDSTYRLVHYNRFFEKPAPFDFILLNKDLRAMQNRDFRLDLKLRGAAVPQEVYLEDGNGYRYKLDKESNVSFSHEFRNLQKDLTFRFFAAGFYSGEYTLEVVPHPTLLNFEVALTYPSYLGKAPETLENTGELLVPEGTGIEWNFNSEHTDRLLFILDGKADTAARKGEGRFGYRLKASEPTRYSLKPQSSRIGGADSINYTIKVIPDLYPEISVRQRPDSVSRRRFYYLGRIRDDHGFTKLTFNYIRQEGKDSKVHSIPIKIGAGQQEQQFLYYLNTDELGIGPGEAISCYFEVFDNDGVNGAKSARTEAISIGMPSAAEQAKEIEQNSSEVKSKLSDASRMAEDLQEKARRLNETLVQERSLSFEEKNQVKELIQQQKQLDDFLQQLKKENRENNLQRSEFSPSENERLLEKQRQIEELFDKVLDEETKKIIEELEKLLEENNKNLTREELNKLQMNNQHLEKELDRLLELYKQLEFDQELGETILRLEELAEKQKELAGNQETKEEMKEGEQEDKENEQQSGEKEPETSENGQETEEKQPEPGEKESETEENQQETGENQRETGKQGAEEREQEEINRQFDQVGEQLEQLEQKNEQLENRSNYQTPGEEKEQIQQELDNSLEQLQQGRRQKARESQRQAAEQMQQLAGKMRQMQQQMAGMQLSVNLHALRQILDNLLKVSFDQETLMEEMKGTQPNDPQFLTLAHKQRALKDDIELVRDSVYSLGKRVPQLSAFVNKEARKIDEHLENALSKLSDRKMSEVLAQQQFVMTSVNNLAVMLSEIFSQLQQQMNNPGQGQGENQQQGLAQLNKMQDELNRRLRKMKEGLKPGERIPREMSEQIARLAREQQAIRNSLQELNKELNKDGQGSLGNLDEVAEEMEKTATDLFNKRITQEMLNRQKEIMTRLLEAEKSERERDTDDEREARQGEQFTPDFSKILEEYNKEKNKELELIHTLPPEVSSFYREKINDYFIRLRETQSQ